MLLELASGDNPYEDGRGWTHSDIRPLPHIEIITDVFTERRLIAYVPRGSCEELQARHVLEHAPYRDTVKILKLWLSLLRPGGKIEIHVPDLQWQSKAHANGEITDEEMVNYAYGDQDYEGNFHHAAFTVDLLTRRLEEAGFVDVEARSIGQVVVATAYRPVES